MRNEEKTRNRPRTDATAAVTILRILETCQASLDSGGIVVKSAPEAKPQPGPPPYVAHPTAVVDPGAEIGEGTRIWHFCHVMGSARIGKACTLGQNVFIAAHVVIGDRVKIQNNVSVYEGVTLEDEPLSNLDLKLREEMRGEIRALQRALGVTTVFVTHDQDEALTMADEIVVMAEGRIVQTGTPAALYERPASRFVAHFLGESNLETGRIDAVLGAGTWRVDAAGLPVVGTGAGAWRPGDTVTVAVRPERVRLGRNLPAGPPAPVNSFGGRIEERVFRGALQRYRVRLPHGRVWSVDEPAAGGHFPYAVGAEVGVSWRPDDCLVIPES